MIKKNIEVIDMKKKVNTINKRTRMFIIMKIRRGEDQETDQEINRTIQMIEETERKELRKLDLTESIKYINRSFKDKALLHSKVKIIDMLKLK